MCRSSLAIERSPPRAGYIEGDRDAQRKLVHML